MPSPCCGSAPGLTSGGAWRLSRPVRLWPWSQRRSAVMYELHLAGHGCVDSGADADALVGSCLDAWWEEPGGCVLTVLGEGGAPVCTMISGPATEAPHR